MQLIPNIPSDSFTLSAIIIGYLLIGDTTSNEQNALGNWLMLIAQVLCTNAYFMQVQSERNNLTKYGKSFFNNDNIRKSNLNNTSENDTIAMLEKMAQALEKEINNLKSNL